MIRSRRAPRRVLAALSAGLLVLPTISGCARDRHTADCTPVDERFWEISDQRRQLIAASRATEEPIASKPADGRVRVESLGNTAPQEQAVATVDPFLTKDEAAKSVEQVAAKQTAHPTTDSGVLADFDAFDRELEALRRDARPAEPAGKPPFDWADEPTATTASPASEAEQRRSVSTEEEFDPAEFAGPAPDAANELLDAPLPQQAANPFVQEPLPQATGVGPETVGPPVVQPKQGPDLRREVVDLADTSMIVDTLTIRPRGHRDGPSLADQVAMIESTPAPPVAPTPEPIAPAPRVEIPAGTQSEPATEQDPWAFDVPAEPAAAEAVAEEPVQVALAAPTRSADVPPLAAPVNELAPSAAPEPSEPAPPLLVAPGNAETAAVLAPPLSSPAADEPTPAPEPAMADPFLRDEPITTVATLETLDFAEEDEAATSGTGTSTAWWFGGLAVAGLLLIARARKRLFA